MAEYQLYCFAQSGNCYRAALMLSVIGADWEPVYVDFFKAGVQRTPDYRENINEMGEAPVLAHGSKKLSQSGVYGTTRHEPVVGGSGVPIPHFLARRIRKSLVHRGERIVN
jgi:hypothetical protein